VAISNYILNRAPTKALTRCAPFQKFISKILDLSNLQIYGCTTWLHVLAEKRTKPDSKAIEAILVGYNIQTKGYRCFEPKSRKILISRNIQFNELELGSPLSKLITS
jgi:hypothetical protein